MKGDLMFIKNKHIKKAIGISLVITIAAFLLGDMPKNDSPIYLLFISIASFIGVYLVSMMTGKAQQVFQNNH